MNIQDTKSFSKDLLSWVGKCRSDGLQATASWNAVYYIFIFYILHTNEDNK